MRKCEMNLFFHVFFIQSRGSCSFQVTSYLHCVCNVAFQCHYNFSVFFPSHFFISITLRNIKKWTILSMEGSCWVVIVLFSKLQEFNCKGHIDNLGQSMSQQCLIYQYGYLYLRSLTPRWSSTCVSCATVYNSGNEMGQGTVDIKHVEELLYINFMPLFSLAPKEEHR